MFQFKKYNNINIRHFLPASAECFIYLAKKKMPITVFLIKTLKISALIRNLNITRSKFKKKVSQNMSPVANKYVKPKK